MRTRQLLVWLPVVSIAACSPVIAAFATRGACSDVPGFCRAWHSAIALLPAILAPLLVLSLLRGLHCGARQFLRTRCMLRALHALPRGTVSASLGGVARELGLQHRLDVVRAAAPEAFCYGLIWPRICVTSGLIDLLAPAELEAVLRHERHHLGQRDPLRALLWTVLDAACWWSEDGGEQATLYRELAADRAVIAAGGRYALAAALMKLLPRTTVETATSGLAISGLSVTDVRIDQLLQPERPLPPPVAVHRRLVLPAAIGLSLLLCA
jgi:beta-lactamase regulating signal transducer with metallopeptidase domain